MIDEKNNSGRLNLGHYNSGRRNSGHYNSGHRNSGHFNSGDFNSGQHNSGFYNSGHRNSGDFNSGQHNSGFYNSGDYNSGFFNSNEPKVRIFNKETDIKREDIKFPNFCYFDLTQWISEDDMTDKEKEAYPSYATNGGYLKVYEYKQAWRNSWDKADDKDRRKILDLPNWDNEIFKEITGIDVEKELNQKSLSSKTVKIEMDGQTYEFIIK